TVAVRRGTWIDVLLVAAGLWCITSGWPAVAVPLAALGLVLPVVRWFGERRGSVRSVGHLVPAALMDGHAAVLATATLTGVSDPADVIETADDMVLEVAAVLAGRPPRGAAQRRFVEARTQVMNSTAAELRERHQAWTEAIAEVDSIAAGIALPSVVPETRDGILVRVLVVALFPFFAVWDLVRLTGRGARGLYDGVALRLRTTARLITVAVRGAGSLALRVIEQWRDLRARIVIAAREARHRFLSIRVRVRIRLRHARRRFRLTR
ncbi:MAG: hypothetical protein QOD92_2986, partial [Acidimicrobiaceae bacterium]